MPLHKFGHHLDSSVYINKIRSNKQEIDCENKRLTSVERGISKNDAVIKEQLDEFTKQYFTHASTTAKALDNQLKSLEMLNKKFTAAIKAVDDTKTKTKSKRITPKPVVQTSSPAPLSLSSSSSIISSGKEVVQQEETASSSSSSKLSTTQ